MIRIQGCYMYMINSCGSVGAFLGFKTLTIYVPECVHDRHPLHAFLKVSRWFYPLARSFSPIYCWGPDKMILPEPFSRVDKPAYIIIRLPYACSDFQKSTLWNLLDMHGHVRGKFCSISKKEREAIEKRYFLTEMVPLDDDALSKAPHIKNAPDVKVLSPLKFPALGYKGKPFITLPAKLSVALRIPEMTKLAKRFNVPNDQNKCRCQVDVGAKATLPSYMKQAPIDPRVVKIKEETHAGGIPDNWVSLPNNFGNILRQYLIGPRDWQHIRVTTIPAPVGIHDLIHFAVRDVYKELVRQRSEKEHLGIPPSFHRQDRRLLCGYNRAESLGLFGIEPDPPLPRIYRGINRLPQTLGLGPPFDEAFKRQYLEGAAAFFDMMVERSKLLLLRLEPDDEDVEKIDKCDLTSTLTPRPIMVCFKKNDVKFGTLMTLPAVNANEIIYFHTTNYFERVLEECEHHYPKLRPINPYLDPAFTYSRYIPRYIIPNAKAQ
ncbi:unnamed protein product [Mesocestoides corti]|uniref:PAZ domain-containing protein n=1 Tax=Mesocestoides corti TaxID=53468 RepID=A0A0R3UMF1_MESCO|nr:unnamed protein product [Mesocestoides corti]